MADIIRSNPFTVRITHDGIDATGYRLYQDGVKVAEVAGTPSNGTIDFVFSNGLPVAKSYNFAATAFNADGESEAVSAILVVLPRVPAAPTTISFI